MRQILQYTVLRNMLLWYYCTMRQILQYTVLRNTLLCYYCTMRQILQYTVLRNTLLWYYCPFRRILTVLLYNVACYCCILAVCDQLFWQCSKCDESLRFYFIYYCTTNHFRRNLAPCSVNVVLLQYMKHYCVHTALCKCSEFIIALWDIVVIYSAR